MDSRTRIPLSWFLPKISGLPWLQGEGRVVADLLLAHVVEGAVVEDVAVLVDLDESGAVVRGGAMEDLLQVRAEDVDGPRDEGRLGAEGQARRVERPVDRPVRRRLGLLADLGRRRVLALRQPVDPVVEHQDLESDVAAQDVDEVVAADRQQVPVAADDPDGEVGPHDLQARRDRGRAAVDAVEAVRVHVVRESAPRSRCPRRPRTSRAGSPAPGRPDWTALRMA